MQQDDDRTIWNEPLPPANQDDATLWTGPSAGVLDDEATAPPYLPGSSPDPPDDAATLWNPEPVRAPKTASTERPEAGTREPRAADRPWIGARVVRGQYELLEELEHGAQAFAYKARDAASGNIVFIKALHLPHADPGYHEQIAIRDALLSLNHRNLMRCLDISLDRGRLYVISEFIPGLPMKQWLREKHAFDAAEILSVVAQLSAGIHALHTQGKLAHRDIKPANILVVRQSDPFLLKIIDYDVACSIEGGGVTPTRGTRYYWPPEFSGRQVANNEAQGADWWGLGRILQELLDGISMQERILRLMAPSPGDPMSVSQRQTFEYAFDEIMAGRGLQRYGVRPGMVEKTGNTAHAERWLPLLRGLLTTTRSDRWGYQEVTSFLAGEPVKDRYEKTTEVEGFVYRGESWELRELARHLIAAGAQQTSDLFTNEQDGNPDPWSEARDFARKGDFRRYAQQTLFDVDLTRELGEIGEVPDRDLGTALVLARLAEADEPPLFKNSVVNRNFALHLAGREDTRAHATLRVLLSETYRKLHVEVHAPSGAELNELMAEAAGLRNRLQQLGVQVSEIVTDRMLLQQVALAGPVCVQSIDAFHSKLSHTAHGPLQQLYAQPSDKLTTVDRHCLLLALRSAPKNGFVTFEAQARLLQARARALRTAAAMKRCTIFYLWWARLLQDERHFRLLLVVLSVAWLLSSGLLGRTGRSLNPTSLWVWLLLAGGLWLCRKYFVSLLRKDLSPLDPDMALSPSWSVQQLQNRTREWTSRAGTNDGSSLKHLRAVNQEIEALPGIQVSEFVVRPASLKRANACIAAVTALLILAIGENRVFTTGTARSFPSLRRFPSKPVPAMRTEEQVLWRGQPVLCVINNAVAISGSNGQPRTPKHQRRIYFRPVVIEGGTVHDLTLDSPFPVFIRGGARKVEINTSSELVINGDINNATVIAPDVEIHGSVSRSRIEAHTVTVTGTVDPASSVNRVPPRIPLPPPRQF